jgi:hypothetical protein
MKHLKIENNKGFYCLETEWKEVDKITKEDLMQLLDKAIANDFEMDVYDADKIANKAHQIIYKNIYEKFHELLLNKNRFKDESEFLYKNALEKYKE